MMFYLEIFLFAPRHKVVRRHVEKADQEVKSWMLGNAVRNHPESTGSVFFAARQAARRLRSLTRRRVPSHALVLRWRR
jgi:hypothetical protein